MEDNKELETKEIAELETKEIETAEIKTIDVRTFIECLSHITEIPVQEFVDNSQSNADTDFWYDPYITTLKSNGFDMLFYSYRNTPLALNDEIKLENYELPQLPGGKCVLLCADENSDCRCVAALSFERNPESKDYKKGLTVLFDPRPDKPYNAILEIGFFINMFVNRVTNEEPEENVDSIVLENKDNVTSISKKSRAKKKSKKKVAKKEETNK